MHIFLVKVNWIIYCIRLTTVCFTEYNVAVFITNQMTADPGGMFSIVQ